MRENLLMIVGAALATLTATSTSSAPPASSAPCSGEAHHQLDFWIGAWKVFDTAKGYQAGTSQIEPMMNGCGIKESYDAPEAPGGPYSGTSYSGFDRKDQKWHQMYVDVNGNVTWYTGERSGPDMVLRAVAAGGAVQRMTYHPLPGGAVEQIGVVSTDGGKSWQLGYDLTYRRD